MSLTNCLFSTLCRVSTISYTVPLGHCHLVASLGSHPASSKIVMTADTGTLTACHLCSGLLSRACSGLLPRSEQATSRDLEIAAPEPSLSLRRSSASQHAWYGTDADGGLDQAPLPAEAPRLQKRVSAGEAAQRRSDGGGDATPCVSGRLGEGQKYRSPPRAVRSG